MSIQLSITYPISGLNLYAIVRRVSDGQYWTGSAFEAYNAANWTTYAKALTENGSSGTYAASASPADGYYQYHVRNRVGGSAATTDQPIGTSAAFTVLGGVESTAVDSVTGNVGGNVVGNVVGSVGSVIGSVNSVLSAVTVGTNNDKTGYELSIAYEAAKTAAQPGDAMTLTSGERTTLTAVIAASIGGSVGDGSVPVNENTGGTDNLRATLNGAGVDNVVVRAYLTSEYDAGTFTVRGQTTTDVDGRFTAPLMLDPEAYTITFSKDGYELTTVEVTVA